MREHIVLAIVMLLSGCGGSGASPAATPDAALDLSPTALLGWPRTPAAAFGCMLERGGAPPGAAYRCGASPPPGGDPCDDTGPYYAGPSFPAALVARIGHGVHAVELEWEHGDLREVALVLTPGASLDDARAAFVPSVLPDNVQAAEVHACGGERWCVTLTGFDHMGAGDLECPDAGP